MTVFADLTLARRLERTEGEANARFVEARARAFPDSGAGWIEVGGAYAMFDGVESPCTQTFGLGIFQAPTEAHFYTIEEFYRERKAPVFHEVSPVADASTLAHLTGRGYRPIELSSVMFRLLNGSLDIAPPRNARVKARLIRDDERDAWAQTLAAGWAGDAPPRSLVDLMRVMAHREQGLSFLAELDGRAIAAGGMSITDGVALLAGASTIPAERNQGAQLTLLNSRLTYAVDHGCDIAMMCTLPGSTSQRNAERNGFRIAYTRIKWQRDLGRVTAAGSSIRSAQ